MYTRSPLGKGGVQVVPMTEDTRLDQHCMYVKVTVVYDFESNIYIQKGPSTRKGQDCLVLH